MTVLHHMVLSPPAQVFMAPSNPQFLQDSSCLLPVDILMEGVVRGEGEEAPKAHPKGVENLQGCLNPHLGEGSSSEESRGLEAST